MNIFQMLEQSGILTVLGMGIVFGFLVIMVICVSIMGKIFHALGIDKNVEASAEGAEASSGAAKSTAVAAAIVAAVTEFHKDNG